MQHLSLQRKFHYPIRHANQFQLLCDGQQFFPRMLAAIANARSHILLEQYLVESGEIMSRFIEQLIAAAQANVKIYILFDDIGSRNLSQEDIHKLAHENIELHYYNPFQFKHFYRGLSRNHRKLLLIDNHTAFIGGAGISDHFVSPANNASFWHELVVEVKGEVVADWASLFATTWYKTCKQRLSLALAPPIASGSSSGRIVIANRFLYNEIARSAITRINTARQRVWLATPYFITTGRLRRAIRRAARRGVDVRLLLSGKYNDHPWVMDAARRYYHSLLKHKVRIYEYQPSFNHAKVIVCDNWVSIGSSNLDRWDMYWNLDANQNVVDTAFSREIVEIFAEDFSKSIELDYEQWARRPLRQHLVEWLAGRLVSILHWLTTLLIRRYHK